MIQVDQFPDQLIFVIGIQWLYDGICISKRQIKKITRCYKRGFAQIELTVSELKLNVKVE